MENKEVWKIRSAKREECGNFEVWKTGSVENAEFKKMDGELKKKHYCERYTYLNLSSTHFDV